MQSRTIDSRSKAFFPIMASILLMAAVTDQTAQAQNYKFKVLHTFHGGHYDGANPFGLLVRDNSGNLYGTTEDGGDGKGLCVSFFLGCGTAFKLNANGKLLWLHSFDLANGEGPRAGLIRDPSGNLFGTTQLGGNTKCYEYGCGTVFELDKAGKKERILHRFAGTTDGMDPTPLLTRDSSGNLYGTSPFPLGSIFKISPSGKLSVLYSFAGKSDGCYPGSGVILDTAGNLYGVASGCGDYGEGVAYELDTEGTLTVLYTFGGINGAEPNSALIFDSAGNLYGTTSSGGSSDTCQGGCGVVFKLSPNGGQSWEESVLYNFCSLNGCVDGYAAGSGPLSIDAGGALYGTAYFGGAYACTGSGCGVVYKLDTGGNETVVYNFTGGKDGAFPFSGVLIDKAGKLYGAAVGYGDTSCRDGKGLGGCDVVFELVP